MSCDREAKKTTECLQRLSQVPYGAADAGDRCKKSYCDSRINQATGLCTRGHSQDEMLARADASYALPESAGRLDYDERRLLRNAFVEQDLDYAGTVRVLRIAQDLAGEEDIQEQHLTAALDLHAQEPAGRPEGEGVPIGEIGGHEEVKRALEVALAGGYSVGLVSTSPAMGDAKLLAQWAEAQGLNVRIATECACGNPLSKCSCSPKERRQWQEQEAYGQVREADVIVPVTQPRWESVRRGMEGLVSEYQAGIIASADKAKRSTRKVVPIRKEVSKKLFRAATRRLGLTEEDRQQIMAMAEVIARLDRRKKLRLLPTHVTEALQYFKAKKEGVEPRAAPLTGPGLGVPTEMVEAAIAGMKLDKKRLKAQIDDRVQALADEVDEARVSAEMLSWAMAMCQIRKYSPPNRLLIAWQCAIRGIDFDQKFASAKDWKEKHRRYVLPGELGLQIICGTHRARTVEVVDTKTGQSKEEERSWTYFWGGNTFAQSQTEGRPLASVPCWSDEGAEGEELYQRVLLLAKAQGVPVTEDAELGGAKGVLTQKAEIELQGGLTAKGRMSTLLHEWCHYEAGHHQQETRAKISQKQRELEAEVSAHVVAAHFGYTVERSSNYLALHKLAGKNLVACMGRVAEIAIPVIEAIEALDETATVSMAA